MSIISQYSQYTLWLYTSLPSHLSASIPFPLDPNHHDKIFLQDSSYLNKSPPLLHSSRQSKLIFLYWFGKSRTFKTAENPPLLRKQVLKQVVNQRRFTLEIIHPTHEPIFPSQIMKFDSQNSIGFSQEHHDLSRLCRLHTPIPHWTTHKRMQFFSSSQPIFSYSKILF